MVDFIPKIKIEIVIEADRVQQVVNCIRESANTGKIGDGKIFVIPVEEALRVRNRRNRCRRNIGLEALDSEWGTCGMRI